MFSLDRADFVKEYGSMSQKNWKFTPRETARLIRSTEMATGRKVRSVRVGKDGELQVDVDELVPNTRNTNDAKSAVSKDWE
jgi:hypothetical protein